MKRKRRHQNAFERAVRAQMDDRLQDAERQLKRLLQDRPRDHEVLHQLGLVHWQQGRTDEGLALLESSAAMAPTEPRYQANLGRLYHEMGHGRAAMAALERAVALAPDNASGWSSYGVALQGAGRLDDAVSALMKATALDGNACEHWQNLATAQQALQQWPLAEASLQQALTLAPGSAEVWTALGAVAEHRQQWAEAESRYRRALLCVRSHAMAWSNLGGVLRRQGRHDEAIAACEQAIALEPSLADAYTHFGLALRAQGHIAPAAATFQRGLQAHVTPEGLLNLADVLDELGQLESAQHALEALCDTFPNFVPGLLAHGRHLLMAGAVQGAAERFARVLVLDPQHAEATHFQQACRGDVPDCAPSAYVRQLFDGYAERFEQHLVGALDYNTPQALVDMLDAATVDTVVDLGCGTGLVGALIRPLCTELIGVDLSPRMLEKAREKGVYDQLIEGSIVPILADLAAVDLAVAADVFNYIGDLRPLLQQASMPRMLFSIEEHVGEAHCVLLPSGRYAHQVEHVSQLAMAAGFAVETLQRVPLRRERGQWVAGALFDLRRVATPQ